jgi:putative ABC transport system substrate-binding protein
MHARRKLLVLAASALAPWSSFAQPPSAKRYRIGFLGTTSPTAFAQRTGALRAALRDAGYVEGRNITIEYRWADGQYARLPELAAELVRLNVDVLVTHGTPGTRAARQATSTIPIVVGASGDLVASGEVSSFSRPGANVTGSSFFSVELTGKRLQLLKEALPRAKRFGVLFNPRNPFMGPSLLALEDTAKSLGVDFVRVAARDPKEISDAIAKLSADGIPGFIVQDDAMLIANAEAVVRLAAAERLVVIGGQEVFDAGAVFYFGANQIELWRRAAFFIDKILRGAKPGDLPIYQASQFELGVNLRSAKASGMTVPGTLLVRADRVIK